MQGQLPKTLNASDILSCASCTQEPKMVRPGGKFQISSSHMPEKYYFRVTYCMLNKRNWELFSL